MKYAGTSALNLRFQANTTTTARTRASINASAAAIAYSPPTRNLILAPDGPASRRQSRKEV